MRGLKYISCADTTGYAIAAKAYVRALVNAGIDLTWVPMLTGGNLYEPYTGTDWPCSQLGRVCNRQLDYDTVLIHTVPEYYPEWLRRERKEGVKVLGYTVWELDSLPSHWSAILNQLDGVIVPCRWNADVFRRSGVNVPLHVVPHLSQFEDLPKAPDDARIRLLQRLGGAEVLRNRYVFYTIGFWTNRKAPEMVLDAYWDAFNVDDPVVLVVKTCEKDLTRLQRHWRNGFRLRHPKVRETVMRKARVRKRTAPWLLIVDEFLSDEEMLALHELGDCYVSLAHSEGWGLGAFDAARLGKPVVMTGYGGQTEFLHRELAWLVDYRMVQVHEPTWSANYRPDHRWAEPSISHAAALLREVYEKQPESRLQAARLAEHVRRKEYSRESIIEAMILALQ